ncbi:unnamed protein product [Phytophthora fragariaefolia]|uniref:Unnamed protein product n=1 Tax=Phytophthora fragariaefolia TaxID=1490495 RepID=A0A9W7CTN8_9STRA|nr:unnamed protein product [Phytophthora fragariaefolia]
MPGLVGSISVSTPNSAVLRVLGCSRQTPALKPSGVASTVVTAAPEVSSTSTRPTVPVSDSVLVSPSGRPRRKSAAIAASLSSHYLTELSVSDRVALGLGGSAESSSDSTSRGAGSSAKPLELLSGSSDAESDSVAASSAENESSRGQTGDPGDQATTAPHPKACALSSVTPALDGDGSSDDSDDISPRDLVSRVQTGRVATHGKARSYLALGRAPPSSPRSFDSAGALSAQWSSSFPKKTKEKKERRKHKHRHKHKHKSRHRHKHKRRLSELEESAGSAGDANRPRRSKRLASSELAGRPRRSKKSRRDLPPSSSRLSDHSAGASPVVPSSLPLTTASVGVTPHPGVHSTPALPAVLRVSSLDGLRAFADVYNPDHPSKLLRRLLPASPMFVSPLRLSEARTRLSNSARASSLMERLAELWVKLRGEISSPTKPGNSASLARDDHPTRYFVALWERTHWVVEASVMMGLHPSQQASRSYEEIADMYAEWFQYKLCRKRQSDALWSLMATISDDLYSAVVKSIGGVPAPDVDAELYFEPSVPVYLLVNLSWISGGSEWCPAVSEVDSAEPWRTWWLTDPARHPYNACFRARNVDFLPLAPLGVDTNIVEAAVEDDVDLIEPDPPIRSTSAPPCANCAGIHIFEGCCPGELGWSVSDSAATAHSARDARDGSDGSSSDSIFGPDSPDLAGSLSSALGSSVGTSSQVSSSAGQHSRTGNRLVTQFKARTRRWTC